MVDAPISPKDKFSANAIIIIRASCQKSFVWGQIKTPKPCLNLLSVGRRRRRVGGDLIIDAFSLYGLICLTNCAKFQNKITRVYKLDKFHLEKEIGRDWIGNKRS